MHFEKVVNQNNRNERKDRMKATQLREFLEVKVVAGVIIQGGSEFLDLDASGYLVIRQCEPPKGFHIVIATEKNGRTLIVQKDVSRAGGGYVSPALSALTGVFPDGFPAIVMRDPIRVLCQGKNVWTNWHGKPGEMTNRVDCFYLAKDGTFGLYQVGVYTHDDGLTYRLHGEWRWLGKLYRASGNRLAAKPEGTKWGSFKGGSSNRDQIFTNPKMVELVQSAHLPTWTGNDAELDPQLPEVPEGNFATVQFYIGSFAGQKGQGLVVLRDGTTAWVHTPDIVDLPPEADGVTRLWIGDIVSFEKKVYGWGSKVGGPPKLTGVKLVKRSW
ncbi:MAG: hypothetical protein NT155_03865 [Candidatus Staskawiczbacteria bacterium]|nr:hypothetical protein [Candidatus Staskawiczbacteria bacterium]